MNILLWVLQAVLALHTVAGALWKFSNSEQVVPSLSAIPHGAWMALSGIELLCALGLLLPALGKPLGRLAPLAALCIAAEMLLFCGVHFAAGDASWNHPGYWLTVAAVCGFIAWGRLVLKPL